ncbi:AsmA-like C-terminal domain-containing protein [Methyloceanibacter sp.]|uniref:YhdP family protein n=1 Tax=Methyloceanibacter sp. TaxID=1965321 RepID=UPI002D5A5385|nr:AsmA-like C-terminal domain-containing protein [Methyloceanibacter sp.]HZP08742.1 AsmA-like C-terminal domain-containing protein [Methyloceanibacter sp.]
MNEPLAGALAKLTSGGSKALSEGGKALAEGGKVLAEGGKALLALPERGRALVKRVPPPVQIELAKLSSRGAHLCREIFAGILVVGLLAIVGGYGRLARGPISLPSLVPTLESAINGQLTDMHVKIDGAILTRTPDGPGVLFRLINIRLIDQDGSIVAQAPLAAIGMSGAALLSGKIAPGSVDFIGPRLLLFYSPEQGVTLTFQKPAAAESETLIRGSLPAEGSPAVETPPATETVIAKRPDVVQISGRRLDLTEMFQRARRGNTSYLTRFGFKNALVVLNQNGTETSWQVPDFAIDLDHRDSRSIIIGQANVASTKGDWQVEVRAEQRTRRQSFAITTLIQNLVPSGLAGDFPSLKALRALDMVVNSESTLELSSSGQFLGGEAKLELESGQISPAWDPDNPMRIDHGNLLVRYRKEKDIVEISPSTLAWGKSKATVSGEVRPVRDSNGAATAWDFTLKANDAVLAVEEFGLPPVRVDEWQVSGNVAPADGRLTISRFVIRAGGASISFAGSIHDAPGSPEINIAGELSPMSMDMLKRFWPKFLAGNARDWTLQRVGAGQLLGGKFKVNLAAGELAKIEAGGDAPDGAINVELDLTGLSIAYMEKLPPVVTGDAKFVIDGTAMSVDIPQGKLIVPSTGEEISLSEGRFYIADLRPDPQEGAVSFKAKAATPAVLALLDGEPLGYLRAVGLKPGFLGGTAEGGFDLSMPLKEDLTFKEVKLRGMARLDQAVAPNLAGNMGIEAGSLDVNVTEAGVEVKGPVQVKGIPAELTWQRVFYATDDLQPPITVTATLDEATREKLGFKVNHLVKGPIPVTLSLAGLGQAAPAMSFTADLTNARLVFAAMGWTKPVGRAASLTFDKVQQEDGSTTFQNFKMVGDDLNIAGDIVLDPEQHLKGFYFSDFSIDFLTHLEITATVRDDQVLDIRATGPTYNGKEFFRSLFAAGQFTDETAEPADPFGVDLTADIDTVTGFYDTNARNVHVSFKKRNGRVVALEARGDLNGKAPAAVMLETNGGVREIRAEARDAGAAFRLVGFYPNVDGGEASLEVNLDAGGPGTKSGTLWTRDFAVLGDEVVNDVLTDPNSRAVLGTQKQAQRTRIEFKQLRAPFSVGGGKFRLQDAYMNGPQLGATMRGTVDFKAQTVDLGGTYVPLYGLNSAFRNIPILGPVLTGRQGEGLVGITFAIRGNLEDPSVLVNPVSVMTPGIFRQIFEFTGSVPDTAAAAPSGASSGGFAPPQ